MRRVRYTVAASLDGYIAGPDGEADWITADPDIDFPALFNQFDTILAGRRTYDAMRATGHASLPGMRIIVFSRTLKQEDHPGVTIVRDGQREMLTVLKATPGKDIWLFGGGSLFASLAEQGLVDTVEVSIIPVLLGSGVRLIESAANRVRLSLTGYKVYGTGIVALEYAIG